MMMIVMIIMTEVMVIVVVMIMMVKGMMIGIERMCITSFMLQWYAELFDKRTHFQGSCTICVSAYTLELLIRSLLQ